MNKENNCQCVVCQVEQSLLDSLSTQTARTPSSSSSSSSGSSRTRISAATERSGVSASRYSGRILLMSNSTPRSLWQLLAT